MNIIKKLFTAVKGGARELGEAVVDNQSTRIFEQEIEDAKNNLEQAKEGLTQIVAKEIACQRNLEKLASDILENESYAVKALDQNNESLALEVAQRIADFEKRQVQLKSDLAIYHTNSKQLKQQIKQAESIISDHERELNIVKTRESVQQATKSVTKTVSNNNSSIGSARESLERIKQKQQEQQDQIDAGIALSEEFSGDDLDKKLTDSGIKTDAQSASSVLERLKEKSRSNDT